MMRASLLVAASICAVPATAFANATIVIVNLDGNNEGFNDPSPATPVGGNMGTTVGEQRLNAFQYAASRRAELIDSNVVILSPGELRRARVRQQLVHTVADTTASLTTDASTYDVGDPIVVSWTGLTTSATNWIAYAPEGSPDTTVTRWVYTGGQAAGSFAFEGAPPGTYVARSFVSGTYNKSGESAPFVIIQ